MRVLLDECVNAGLRRLLKEHEVRTVPEMGWNGLKNGKLLAEIAGRFDVFLTIDQNIRHQQNLSNLPFTILFVFVPNNMMDSYRPLSNSISTAISASKPGDIVTVP